ncbi:MAG TPA: tetratricopeptide repeat protein, partial [Ktedonobacteraceae bacterium]|nr:tetratricopeptide repeat protein [Ktedonobacteraceae bacterium]
MKNLLLVQSTGLIGREQEIMAACALLQRASVRLLTITGPGGVGKTRLALQVATELTAYFPDGVCCVSLAVLRDPALVIPTIAQELGFLDSGEEPLFARIEEYLHTKRFLLVLDNFEYVTAASPTLTDLLSSCPGLKILITSREVLHIRIEHELVVPPLALPSLKPLPNVEQLLEYPAVALFMKRAIAAKPDFQLSSANARTIAEVCIRLDGLPLAIELAAARIKLLSPYELLARLEHRLQVLTGGAHDLPRRQQTLRNTLTWSYDLLTLEEQQLFRRLSVFARGCTLETIEELYGNTEIDVLGTIVSLINKNLVQRVEQTNGDGRIVMLETVREYGQECLAQGGEAQATFQAHALYYLDLAERAEGQLRKEQQARWLDRLEQEYDNLRVALHWFVTSGDASASLRLCGALNRFWLVRDHQMEGYQWIEKAMALSAVTPVPESIMARALLVAGILADNQGHHQLSADFWQRSKIYYQKLGDMSGFAAILNKLGSTYARTAFSKAHQLYVQSLKLARQQNDPETVIDALISLADEAITIGDYIGANNYLEEGLAFARIIGDERSIASCLGSLGQITIREGNYARAYLQLKESLEFYRKIGDRVNVAFALIPLGMATLYQGDYQTACKLLDESSTASKGLGDRNKIAHYLGSLGKAALLSQQAGDTSAAHMLLEESLAIFHETNNEEGIASKLFTLGCREFLQGSFTASIQLMEQSLSFFTRLGNRVMTAASLYMLGQVYERQGKYQKSYVLIEQSLTITREIGDRGVLSSRLGQLGLVALNSGKYDTA